MFDQEYISKTTIDHKDDGWFQMRRANVEPEAIRAYECALNPKANFWTRVKHFLTAQNKAGRKAKIIKDFALFFVPYGRQISNLTELATHIMKDKEAKFTAGDDEMVVFGDGSAFLKGFKSDGPKKPYQSKTVITFGLLFLASLLQALGVIDVSAMGLEISPDAAWVVNISSIVGIILRAVTDKPVKLK